MVDISGDAKWSPVRVLEDNELARGGINGNMNEQAKALVNRTEFLSQEKANKKDIVQGQYRFTTLAKFNAVKSTIPVNSTVIIDEAGENQGANTWDGSILKKSSYDPLQQANIYTDTFLKDVTTLPNGTDLNTIKTFGYYLLPLANTYINMPSDWVYDDNSVMNVCQSSGGFFEQRLHKINQSTGTWARSCLLSNGNGTWKEPSNRNIRTYTEIDPKTINIAGCFVIIKPVAVPSDFIGSALLIVERFGNFTFRKIIQTNGKRSYSQVNSNDWDAGILASKEYVDSFDSLTINRSKQYPNKPMSRNGAVSSSNSLLLDCIIDAQVIGAEDGYVYGLRYFKNGTTALPGHPDGWMIEEQLESTYNTTATANLVVNYTDTTPDLARGGIQTIHIISTRKIGLEFIITIDTDKLPNYGTYIAMNTAGQSGYSWIIDKSCYLYKSSNSINKSDLPRKFLYNRGDNFPFEIATFREKTSISNSTLLNCFQNVVVENAEEGYRYMLGYYTNGSTAFGAEFTERWIVFKRSASNYSDVSATEEQIVDLFLPQDTLNRSGNFETIKLRSIGREIIHITVDTSKLPTYGTFIAASTPTTAAWSWMIVPSNYIYSKRTELNNYFEYDAVTKDIIYRYKSGAYVHQWTFGINGANNLPNFKSQKRALSNNVLSGRFLSVQDFSTDWLPPLVFYAENGDVGASTGLFTGGNHASNGDATGNPTAENELYEIFIDGIKLDKTKSIKCYVDNLSLKIVNKIQASNTRTSGRFVLRQVFDVNFRSTRVDVHCQLKPLEKIFIRNDYALQMTTVGFQTTQLILSGKDLARIAFNANETSGTRALYPNAWAVILKGANGQLSSWIDRSYGNGVSTNVAPNQPLIRGGTGTNTKYYHAAFRSFGDEPTFPPLELNVNSVYKWRGGYAWQDSTPIANYDSVIDTSNGIVSVIDANIYF